ncbi:MAG: hypothetical protein JXB45_02500 [Candidatus Krumholzibacteriota bacterium]|nr:hypothetical protein [Candidatus Krumholzibacteriota bacterium]
MAETNIKTVLSHGKKSVDIIEFGKGLYNQKSVVLMPARVGSDDGPTGDANDLLNLTMFEGIASLAAVYKQFEFDPRRQLVLAGHADPGGDTALNFDLSKKRAEAIYCLLNGQKDRWADLALDKHVIQDYKWMMTYFSFSRPDFDCDPENIDNNWDDKTYQALKNFFAAAKKYFKLGFADDLADKVKDDADKKWPKVIWKAVFDLYLEDICGFLKIKPEDLAKYRKKNLKFPSKGKKFVGCADSFPLHDPEASKYHKDKYRRVDALFFYRDQVPGVKKGTPKFICPAAENQPHKAIKCPLYYDGHFQANYISPLDDLSMIAYHLKFDFFNAKKIKKKNPPITQVPEGLTILAYHYTGAGAAKKKESIPSITKYNEGKYTVKVTDDGARTNIHFEFKTAITIAGKKKRRWVYTKDKNAKPKLVIEADDDINKLMKPDKFAERQCYYDLPEEWSSENYMVRYKEGAAWRGGRFHDVLKDKLKLKPYGNKPSDINNPLIFSLDDIVLVKADGKQDIKDKDQNNGAQNLSANSRITLFHVEKQELQLYKLRNDGSIQAPKVTSPCFSDIDFRKDGAVYNNVITDVPPDTRGILFANEFYGVFDKRAGQAPGTFDPAKMQIKGCRAACLKDDSSHLNMKVQSLYLDTTSKVSLVGGSQTINGTGTKFLDNVVPGHKLFTWFNDAWKATTYTVDSVQSDTRLTVTAAPAANEANVFFKIEQPHNRHSCQIVGNFNLIYLHYCCPIKGPGGLKVRSFLIVYWNGRFVASGVTNIQLENFERLGCKNARERWNYKGYTLEPVKLDADRKGKIQIKPYYFFEAKTADRGGRHKCTVSITNNANDGEMGIDTSKMYHPDYKIRNYLSAAQYGGAARYTDIDGKQFEGLTVSHEFGHATGLYDDYMYDKGEHKNDDDSYFGQYYPGMPYHHDLGSMMQTNRAPRMRELYHFINRINDASEDNNELKKLLNGTLYQAVHRYKKGGANKTMHFHLKKDPHDYRDIYKPFKSKRAQNTGTGSVDLHLYKIGTDEMSRTIKIGANPPGFAFNGIQVVFIKIGFIFHDHGANNWAAVDKTVWMNDVKAKLKALNNRFYLKNSGAKPDFKKTYLFFFPICLEYSAINAKVKAAELADGKTNVQATAAGNAAETATKNAANYTIEVTFNNTRDVTARVAPLSTLKVGELVDSRWIARYILGHDPGGTTWNNPTPVQAQVSSADLAYVRTWIRSASGLGDNTFNFVGT